MICVDFGGLRRNRTAIAVQKTKHSTSHISGFLMTTGKHLLLPMIGLSERSVGGFENGIDRMYPVGRCERIVATDQRQVSARRYQSTDFGGAKFGSKSRHEEVFTVLVEAATVDERVVFCEAAEINAGVNGRVERCRPDSHCAAH